jgi:hypothetical protein
MTARRFTIPLAAAAIALTFCFTWGVASASAEPDTTGITTTASFSAPSGGGPQHAKPRGETSSGSSSGARSSGSRSSSGTRSSSHAVPRGSEPTHQVGQRRPEAGSRTTGGGYVHHGSGRRYATIYWGPWGYPWGWWTWGWPYYPWGVDVGVRYYPSQARPSMGALDLDIRPEEARIYLNGQVIGIADNFDGWPSYLWLDKGTYDLVFYREGYQTLARQYSIYPGVIIDVEDRMVRGESTPPEELIARATERREERMRRDEERAEDADAMEPAWKERVREERERSEREPGEAMPYDARQEPVRLALAVTPPDAAVYLDGRFIGAAGELFEGGAAVVVDPGEHELEIVRPGYASKRTTFDAESGETVELTIELEELE